MPLSDLELRERDLELRIAETERHIGEDLELLRQTARRASASVVQVVVGAGILLGAFVVWRMVSAWRRPRYFEVF